MEDKKHNDASDFYGKVQNLEPSPTIRLACKFGGRLKLSSNFTAINPVIDAQGIIKGKRFRILLNH